MVTLRRALGGPGDERARAIRLMVVATFVSVFGSSMFAAIRVFYLVGDKHLTSGQTGVLTAVASAIAVLGAVPFAYVVVRVQPALIKTCLLLSMALISLAYLAASSFWTLLLVAGAVAFLDRGVASAHGGLVATVAATSAERATARAQVRVALSSGVALGGLAATIPLSVDSARWYAAVILVQSACFLVSGLVYALVVSDAAATMVKAAERGSIWRDRRFTVFALATGLVTLHYPLLSVGIPLWVIHLGLTQRWIVGVLLSMKAVGVIIGQLKVSRYIDSRSRARRSLLFSGGVLAVVCVLLAVTAAVPAGAALVLLVLTGLLLIAVDVLLAAGQFYLSFDLAPESRQLQYQSFMTVGPSIAAVLGPVLFAWAPVRLGSIGWLLTGVVLLACTAVADRALTRAPAAESVEPAVS